MTNEPRFPIGVQLASAARAVERAFETVLAESGGSIPVWLVLLNLKLRRSASQRELAAAVGVQASTLSIHLSEMERQGFVVRRREPDDRRTQTVQLTSAGEAVFARIRSAAGAFDSALRHGFSDEEISLFEHLLFRLVANVSHQPKERRSTRSRVGGRAPSAVGAGAPKSA
ncbi:MAG: MarR family winged helix-turn-helix transcriptional regulator [Acidimicrobiales bacterium]